MTSSGNNEPIFTCCACWRIFSQEINHISSIIILSIPHKTTDPFSIVRSWSFQRWEIQQFTDNAGNDLDLRDLETSWGSARDLSPYPKMCEFTSDYSLFMRKCKEKHVYNYFDDKSPLRIHLTIGHNDRRKRPFFFIKNLGKNNHIILGNLQPTNPLKQEQVSLCSH